MTIYDVLEKLNIPNQGNLTGKTYVMNLDDSDDYGKYYSLIDKNSAVEYQEENSSLNLMGATLIYILDNFLITLYADYDEDEYKLVIKDLGDK